MDFIRDDVKVLFHKSVLSVLPKNLINNRLQRQGNNLIINEKTYLLNNNCYIVGFGKAVMGMTAALVNLIEDHLIEGVISVPVGIQETFADNQEMIPAGTKVKIIEGAKNNLPDENSLFAAKTILDLVTRLKNESLLFVLISGGGSALLPLPIPQITFDYKIQIIRELTKAAANIVEMNCVRKKLSVVKGGGLAKAAYPCQTVGLILSDVIGDPLDSIASGPTCPNTDDPHTAFNILQKYGVNTNRIGRSVLKGIDNSKHQVPMKEGQFDHVDNILIGNNQYALETVAKEAIVMQYIPVIVSSRVDGIAKNVAENYANLALCICNILEGINIRKQKDLRNVLSRFLKEDISNELLAKITQCKEKAKGLCCIFGGETTVRVKGNGVGGRNQELALAFAVHLHDLEASSLDKYHVCLLSAGTDGIDGPTSAAGAVSYQKQFDSAWDQDLDPYHYLQENDSHRFYATLDHGADLVNTGHTGTNVMDLQILIIKSKQ